jgi:hypothetical protein
MDLTAMPKKKKEVFSVTKSVRANARERLGQPKPSRVIPEKPVEGERENKHKETLSELLAKREE